MPKIIQIGRIVQKINLGGGVGNIVSVYSLSWARFDKFKYQIANYQIIEKSQQISSSPAEGGPITVIQ